MPVEYRLRPYPAKALILLYLFDNCALDTSQRELRRGGDAIPLQPQVFDLLEYLIRHRDRVVTKDDLIGAIWGGRIVANRPAPPASTRPARE